ncbi:MAG: RNA polymerase sigma factor [Anaerolineales bacterium]|jgi:RNA polymerase sigma-70 factor (ECF subfamily)
MDLKTDADLVQELQQGSLDALGTLYDRHRQMVYRTALAISGDAEAASDLLQDVFLRLHRFADHVDTSRPLEPWLYRVTANLSYTWVKQRQRWFRPLEDIAEWFAGGKRNSLQQMAEMDDELRQVSQAISALILPQRMVVVLYYLNDLSVQEIADILNVPIGTVKSRLHYGRQALKKQLGLQHDLRPEVQYEFT